jgi:hypothetical protein
MLEKYKIGNLRKIKEISKYTCSDIIYRKYFEEREAITDLKDQRQEKLEKLKFDARTAEVYSYVFVMNEVFEIGLSDEKLLEYVKKNIKLSSENEDNYNNEERPELILKQILTE